MITKEAISKVTANVKNDQILNILAKHLKLTQNEHIISRFIEMCLCDNNEIKSFIKTKDDFNNIKIIEAIDKLLETRCIANIKDINNIDWLTGDMIVVYNFYKITYHCKQDLSDDGLCWKTEENKYAKIHTDNVYSDSIILNYYTNDVLV